MPTMFSHHNEEAVDIAVKPDHTSVGTIQNNGALMEKI